MAWISEWEQLPTFMLFTEINSSCFNNSHTSAALPEMIRISEHLKNSSEIVIRYIVQHLCFKKISINNLWKEEKLMQLSNANVSLFIHADNFDCWVFIEKKSAAMRIWTCQSEQPKEWIESHARIIIRYALVTRWSQMHINNMTKGNLEWCHQGRQQVVEDYKDQCHGQDYLAKWTGSRDVERCEPPLMWKRHTKRMMMVMII